MNSTEFKAAAASHADNEKVRIRDLHRAMLRQTAQAIARNLHEPHELHFVLANVKENLKHAEWEQKDFDALVDTGIG